MSNVVHIPLAQGTRVRVIKNGPPPPNDRGIIWKHQPDPEGRGRDAYLVQLDSAPWPIEDGLPGARMRLFTWAHDEIEVEEPKVVADPHLGGVGTPAEQHRSLMETLLALRAAEGGIAETQEEEILVRLDELWGQLTEAERDLERELAAARASGADPLPTTLKGREDLLLSTVFGEPAAEQHPLEWRFEKQTVAAHGEAVLETTVTVDCWMRTPLLETDDPHPHVFLVTSITFANVKVSVGAHGTPLSVINRFGTSLGEVLMRAGETVRVVVRNVDNQEHAVWGRCAGSLKPNAGRAQRVVTKDK